MSTQEMEARIEVAISTHATTLDLRGLGLKELAPLPHWLQAVELGRNRLPLFPDELMHLTGLRRLGLGNNRIAELPADLAGFQDLVSLDLSENRLQALPVSIGVLRRLVELSLFGNRLADVPVSLFFLKCLERLDLSTNRLSELPSLAGLHRSRIRVLDVSCNRLGSIPDGIGKLRSLKTLNLAENQVTSLDPLKGLDLLENLDVSGNKLTSVMPALGHLARLENLDVSGNSLSAAGRDFTANFSAARADLKAQVDSVISVSQTGDGGIFHAKPPSASFESDIAVGGKAASDLVDLYFKRYKGNDFSLQLADGSSLELNRVTRTLALDFARTAAASDRPVRLQLGQAEPYQLDRKRDFVVDALAQIPGSQLVGVDSAVKLPATEVSGRDITLQWREVKHLPEPVSRTVGLGFAPIDEPETPISEFEPLACNTDIWLWCTVSGDETIPGALGGGELLAPSVRDHAELEVVVFTNEESFTVESRSGTLLLAGNACQVLRHADVPERLSLGAIDSRLFFKLRTPKRAGPEQVRVHLYHRGLLVQAFDIIASIGKPSATPDNPQITVTTDYVLSDSLEDANLLNLGEHTLSIFANDSPKEKSGFRFFGADGEFAASSTVEAEKIGDILEQARRTMREVSWDSKDAYNPSRDSYRYEPDGPQPDLKEDLVRLAKCGYQIWDVLANSLAGDGSVAALEEAMRRPGVIQLGLKDSFSRLLPLAIMYDRPIDTQLKDIGKFSLCDAYWHGPDCLEGNCTSLGKPRVVCPSGFWGYRHSIGVPIGPTGIDATAKVAPCETRIFASAYAGDFPLRDAHLENLEKLAGPGAFQKTLSYEETVDRMQQGGFQLLYFYCHGGVDDTVPYVLVGRDDEDPNQIVRATLRANRITWPDLRTLVFINGCHTTALEPESAIDLVNGFVETAQASGVIGTEVTVFEPVATQMGEDFVKHLLAGADVGTALRDARRTLLHGDRPNPLGLVYIPFALATLKLMEPPVLDQTA